MAPAPAWPQRGQAQRSLQQGREGGCARGGLCGCRMGTRSHTWALRAGNTALPPCLGAATLPGRCHPARVLPQVPEQRGPWWTAGKLGDSALASGACCDVSGSILSVRAATKPCGGVKSPPCSSALLWVCMRCVARGLCRAFGWGVTAVWLCSWGITSLGCTVLSHGCVIWVRTRPALPLPGWEQCAKLPYSSPGGCRGRAAPSKKFIFGVWVPAHSTGVIFPPPCAGKVSRASATLTCPCGL